jgi:hypothetical protein
MMNFSDLDPSDLRAIETKYKVQCLEPLPFKPNNLVRWKCAASHEWIASYIDLQILKRCYQCDPQDIKTWGNGTFAQGMSFTMAKVAADLKAGVIQTHGYHHDSQLHASIAAFFFTAVKNEFSLKVLSANNATLRLGEKTWWFGPYRPFSAVQLIERMFKVSEKNIAEFTVAGMTSTDLQTRYRELKKAFVTQVEVRNKIAHGFAFYPVTKKHKYNPKIADTIKLLGAGELEDAYAIGSTFLAVSEKLLNTSAAGINLGNKLLRDYILLR